MASTAATCSPSSLQLRLALNYGNGKVSRVILFRTGARKLNLRIRVLCAAQNGNEMEGRPNGNSWNASGFAADDFAGWSGSVNADRSVESQRKKWLGGVVGAGVAGIVLVAGLTFAASSLRKRSTYGSKQQIEPLTTQQEVLLASENEDDKAEENKNKGNNERSDDSNLESRTGVDTNISSSPELYEAPNENKIDEHGETSSVDNITDTIVNASVQEDLQHESTFDNKSVAPGITPISTNLSESEIAGYGLATRQPEPTSEIEQTSVYVELAKLSNTTNLNTDDQGEMPGSDAKEKSGASLDSSNNANHEPGEPTDANISISSTLDINLEPQIVPKDDVEPISSVSSQKNLDLIKTTRVSVERSRSPGTTMSASAHPFSDEEDIIANVDTNGSSSVFKSPIPQNSFSTAGIPAPSVVSEALHAPGKVLVPAVVDQVQGQAFSALQVLKVIEADVQPGDLCTRREYARWLVAASSALSRNTVSKVYPAMYIEDITELAFDDITPDDPDFSSIQGLAEAGLISSKLSNQDLHSYSDAEQGPFYFYPESALSRQDLVSWKMALERRQLPDADKKILYQLSGFRDIDKINPDAWPALIADLSTRDQGIISLAFGCTRLFQPDKPVTKAQAAVALATGEASDIVSEELARIEAESIAENAVSAHNDLVAQVEMDINASFEKELFKEREKINVVEKMAEEARHELEKLRTEREADNIALMKERAAIESEMEVLSRLRHEMEEQLQSLTSNKVEISYEKERISKLQKEAEDEKQEITRLQYELEVERKALSMARAWAEEEAKRAREQAKALEEARDRWERHGIKVVVDNDLREESSAGVTWLNAGKQFSVEGTVSRAENLVDKLKLMSDDVGGKSREVINKIVQKICFIISILKDWISKTVMRANDFKDVTISKTRGSIQELQQNTAGFGLAIKEKAAGSIEGLQQSTAEFSLAVKEGAKRIAGDCREGVEKLTQKFKS